MSTLWDDITGAWPKALFKIVERAVELEGGSRSGIYNLVVTVCIIFVFGIFSIPTVVQPRPSRGLERNSPLQTAQWAGESE